MRRKGKSIISQKSPWTKRPAAWQEDPLSCLFLHMVPLLTFKHDVLKSCNLTRKKQQHDILDKDRLAWSCHKMNHCWITFPLMSLVEATEGLQEGTDKQSRSSTHCREKATNHLVCPWCFTLMITPWCNGGTWQPLPIIGHTHTTSLSIHG